MDRRALAEAARRKSRESVETQSRFFAEHGDTIVSFAEKLHAVYQRGGRLFVFGNGGSACDAAHLAVELGHPIVEKRAALPAISLSSESAFLTAVANDQDFSLVFAKQLKLQARAEDAALGISSSGKSASVNRGLRAARDLGMTTLGLSGKDGGAMVDLCDVLLLVPSYSIHRIQEVHAVLIHVVWDLLHVLRGGEDVL
jgi:D-sedoheptulose 7-phosphate isomerase